MLSRLVRIEPEPLFDGAPPVNQFACESGAKPWYRQDGLPFDVPCRLDPEGAQRQLSAVADAVDRGTLNLMGLKVLLSSRLRVSKAASISRSVLDNARWEDSELQRRITRWHCLGGEHLAPISARSDPGFDCIGRFGRAVHGLVERLAILKITDCPSFNSKNSGAIWLSR